MKLLAAFFSSLLLFGSAASADDATKNAKIEELLTMTKADQMVGQMFDQVKTMEIAELNKTISSPEDRQMAQQTQDKMLNFLRDNLTWEKMKPKMIGVYAQTFSEEEVDGILSFYKSAAGQAMLQKMPVLMQRSLTMGQQMVAEIMPQLQKIIQDMHTQSGTNSAKPQ